jgi:hypothetical protein
MALTEHQKRYMKNRRANLRARGICVDCQKNAAKPGVNGRGKPFVCCDDCLQQRRTRWHDGAMPPLLRAIQNSERVH